MSPELIASLVSGVGGWLGQQYNRKQEQKQYDRMLKYNSPKAQMQRFKEAGLSPYLIYGQGSSGNVSSPAPASIAPDPQEGISKYIGAKTFSNENRLASLQRANLMYQNSLIGSRQRNVDMDTQKKELEMFSDYPDAINSFDSKTGKGIAGTGFRRKLNELKTAASMAMIDKLKTSIQGMSSDNLVKSVKAKYATDYGMVGGDWTQGLGLIKSLPSFFKSRATKAISTPPAKVRYNSPTNWRNLGY